MSTFFSMSPISSSHRRTSSIPQKQSVPGYHYITKVMTFFEKHYHNGKLYFEYIKEGCLETNQEPCDKCMNVEWVGPRCSRVPSPMPDPNNEGHYLPLSDTSTTTVNGDLRVIDDLAPRANIRKQFKNGLVSSSNCEQISSFSKTFCVEEKYVVSYVKHLEQLAAAASIREKEKKLKKKIEEAKTYKEYNWPDLFDSGKLNKIKVKEFDKYLLKHNLSTANKKADKVKRITAHYYLTNECLRIWLWIWPRRR